MAFASSTTNLNQLFPSSESISIVWENLNKSLQALQASLDDGKCDWINAHLAPPM